MSITEQSIKDREFRKFRESSDRAGEPAVDVYISNPGDINGTSATTPNVYNISVASANTEESQALPANTKAFIIRVRGASANLKLAFTSGQSGSTFLSVPRGSSYRESGLNVSSLTIYFQTDQPSQVVELITWG